MSEKVFCEKCGAEMSSYINGSSCGMECKSCGWGWATTYRSPIEEDNTDYELCIEPIINPSVDNLRCIASLLGCNFITAKSKMQDKIVMTRKAIAISDIALKLKSNNIAFTIMPEFPYETE